MEEPTPETWMLNHILYRRYAKLHGEEIFGRRQMNSQFRDGFEELTRRHFEIVEGFVHWKRTSPEGAVLELLLTAQGLENPDVQQEDATDLAKLVWDLDRRGFYRAMRAPQGEAEMSDFMLGKLRGQSDIHRRLLERAAEGLRPALERGPLYGVQIGSFARRLAEYGRRNLR